jgi:hypothetical protein
MTAHARSQIRDTAATAVTGLATTGARVYKARTRDLGKDHAPALLVYTTTDIRWPAGDAMGSPPIAGRRCALVLEGKVSVGGASAAEAAEDLLDQIEVETNAALIASVLDAAGALKALKVKAIDFQSATKVIRALGAAHVGSIRIEFAVLYRTAETDLTVLV